MLPPSPESKKRARKASASKEAPEKEAPAKEAPLYVNLFKVQESATTPVSLKMDPPASTPEVSVPSTPEVPLEPGIRRIAIAGNPNCGKSTLFNALTGLRQKVGNYPGVTVEKKDCLLYTSPSPRDRTRSRMPSSA